MKLNGFMLQAFLAGLTILSCVALGELSIRLLQYVRDGRPFLARVAVTCEKWVFATCDPNLGWKTPANQRAIYVNKDSAGVDHAVHYSTGPYGFRLYARSEVE
jgi:hypothetical protein